MIISHVTLFMIISHVKIIAFQTITNHSFWTFYIGEKPVVYIIINRKIHWVLGNTRFISRVEHDISPSFAALTREISCSTLEKNLVFPRTHVAIILYVI